MTTAAVAANIEGTYSVLNTVLFTSCTFSHLIVPVSSNQIKLTVNTPEHTMHFLMSVDMLFPMPNHFLLYASGWLLLIL